MTETPAHHPLSIFLVGVTGDLSKKKILKAIYNLFRDNHLQEPFTLIGNARTPMSHDEFRDFVQGIVRPTDDYTWERFSKGLFYVSGDATDSTTFQKMSALHTTLKSERTCGNHLWYLATLPSLYLSVVQQLKSLQLYQTECGWTKIMIEKPFGMDLASAKELNEELTSVFEEDQIYRIDHFLGKETVQNLLAFRFGNGLFEHLWNKKYVDHIQVTLSETLGAEGREQFYDETGATRDVLQNHLLQMIAVTMMDEPKSLHAKDIRASRSQLLASLSCAQKGGIQKNVRFGQYTSGDVNGKKVAGYTELHKIPDDSKTETAVAAKLEVDSERWNGVPIYIRTGKRFDRDVLEISVQFKDPQNPMFKDVPYGPDPNVLSFRFQPNEGIILKLFVKKPGHGIELDPVNMDFSYRNQYQMNFIEAYERLIYDASQSDSTLFPSADGIEATWKIVDDILKYKNEVKPDLYEAGTWGPESFEEFIEQDGRKWIEPNPDVCRI